MKHPQLILLGAAALGIALAGCKKAESPAAPTPAAESQPSSQAAAPAATPTMARESSDKGTLLQMKWPVGSRYVYRMDLDQNSTNTIPQMPRPMQQNVNMAMTYALSVLKETAEGGRELEMEFLANEMEVKMGEQVMVSFDSKEAAGNEAPNPFVTPFRKMIGSKVRLQIDSTGKVEKVLGLEEWLDQLAGEGPGPARGMLSQQFNEGYFRQVVDFGQGFPSKPVEVGDSWPFKTEVPAGPLGKLNVDSTFMFKGWEERDGHKCAMLTSLGTFKGESSGQGQGPGPMGNMSVEQGKLNGTTWFDPEQGNLVESTVDQSMRMSGQMGGPGNNPGGAKFTSDIAQKVNVKLVEVTKGK